MLNRVQENCLKDLISLRMVFLMAPKYLELNCTFVWATVFYFFLVSEVGFEDCALSVMVFFISNKFCTPAR